MGKEPDKYTANSLKVRLYPTLDERDDVMNVNRVNLVLVARRKGSLPFLPINHTIIIKQCSECTPGGCISKQSLDKRTSNELVMQ